MAFSSTKIIRFRRMAAISVCLLLTMATLNASGDLQTRWQGGISGQGGFPTGAFRDNLKSASGGMGLEILYTPKKSPLALGMTLGFLIYGVERSQEYFQAQNADFDLDLSTTNNIFQGHVLLRYLFSSAAVRPYLDVLFGVNHFTTDTKIEGSYDADTAISTNNLSDTAFSYGAGVGLMVRVFDSMRKRGDSRPQSRKWEVLIDLRLRFMKGMEAEYLNKGGIVRENADLLYDVRRSETDLLTTQIGLIFNF